FSRDWSSDVCSSDLGKKIWEHRFEDIRNFEQFLARNGVVVRKFFLNVSKKEQKRRFLERIDDPLKNWKFSSNDANERDFWDDYRSEERRVGTGCCLW